jgi:hypothetical protein
MIKMIDLKSVIDFINIKYLKKVSSIIREEVGSDKNWSVIFEGETEFKLINLNDEDLKKINMFYEIRIHLDSVVKDQQN